MANAADSKSVVLTGLWVRLPPSVPSTMKRTRARSGIEPLGAVLSREGVVKAPKAAPRAPISDRDWEAAVGSRIALRAQPMKLERGVLLVRAASAVWSQELSLLATPIVEQLRARGVNVHELRFRVGPVEPPERAKTREEVRTTPPAVRLPDSLAEEIRRVADDDLRKAIAAAASKNLGWQRMRKAKASAADERQGRRAAPTNPDVERIEESASKSADKQPATTRRDAPGPRPAAPRTDPPARAEAPSSASRRGNFGST